MRIEQNQKMDANVVVTGNARQDNVAAAKKDASIVRIEKDRKADRLLEQPDLWQAGKRGKCLRGDSGAGIQSGRNPDEK